MRNLSVFVRNGIVERAKRESETVRPLFIDRANNYPVVVKSVVKVVGYSLENGKCFGSVILNYTLAGEGDPISDVSTDFLKAVGLYSSADSVYISNKKVIDQDGGKVMFVHSKSDVFPAIVLVKLPISGSVPCIRDGAMQQELRELALVHLRSRSVEYLYQEDPKSNLGSIYAFVDILPGLDVRYYFVQARTSLCAKKVLMSTVKTPVTIGSRPDLSHSVQSYADYQIFASRGSLQYKHFLVMFEFERGVDLVSPRVGY